MSVCTVENEASETEGGDEVLLVERDISLLETYVAGTHYYEAKEVEGRLYNGMRLELHREPENQYDAKAIEVKLPGGPKLGYVPRDENSIPSRLMDAGKELFARIETFESVEEADKVLRGCHGSLNVEIELCLRDWIWPT